MARFLLLLLALATTCVAGQWTEGDHNIGDDIDGTTSSGITYKTLPGFRKSTCGEECQHTKYMTPSSYVCAILCTMDVKCKSALYRVSDGYCSMKTEPIASEKLGIMTDDSQLYIAIRINRPEPSPSPSPSPTWEQPSPSPEPSPSPTWEQPSPSPSPAPSPSPTWEQPSPSPSPKPSPSPSWEQPSSPSWEAPSPSPSPSPSWETPSPSPSPIPSPDPSPSPDPIPSPTPSPVPSAIGRDGDSGGSGGSSGGANGVGQTYRSTMTIFHGFGIPYGGCGVPQDDMIDATGKMLPYVALNRYTASGSLSMFQEGKNCGRWIKIKIGMPCGGANDGQGGQIEDCIANYDVGEPSPQTGKVIYGYVGDSCQDTNGWCRNDEHHIDMGIENMEREGLEQDWRNNRIEWQFLDGTPPGWVQGPPQFRWCKDSKIDWLCLIVVKVSNGVKKMEVLMDDGNWEQGTKVYILGQMFNLPPSTHVKVTNGKYTVRVEDYNGKSYGEFQVNPPQGLPYVTDAQ